MQSSRCNWCQRERHIYCKPCLYTRPRVCLLIYFLSCGFFLGVASVLTLPSHIVLIDGVLERWLFFLQTPISEALYVQLFNFSLTLLLRPVPQYSSICGEFLIFYFISRVLALTHACEPWHLLIDRCVPFQSISNQLNLPQVDWIFKQNLHSVWKLCISALLVSLLLHCIIKHYTSCQQHSLSGKDNN